VSEIDAQLEAGDAERAVTSCRSALDEFPDDPEIKELLKLAEKRLEKVNQAKERLNAAREALEGGRADEGLDLLREARRFDERNTVIKTLFVHALVERAHGFADSDWQQAAALVDEVYRQEPDYPALEGLRKKLETHKKNQFVGQFLPQRCREGPGSLSGRSGLDAVTGDAQAGGGRDGADSSPRGRGGGWARRPNDCSAAESEDAGPAKVQHPTA
jgi:tetratricopeptide (TPR) repeat protein